MASDSGIGANVPQLGAHPRGETAAPSANSFLHFEKSEIEQAIPNRFEQQVCLFPDKVAVRTADESLTYSELNRFANQIARAILSICPSGNEPVGLFFDQGASLIAAILGTLKAGKIYVPLGPLQPETLNTEVLLDSMARLVLTDTLHVAQASKLAMQDISVINIREMDSNISAENVDLAIDPDFLAYIFYTSGSTGRPKGVADSHRNVLHNIMRYTNSLRISASDRLTLLQPGHFSGAVSSLFCALLNGATSFPFSLRLESSGRLASWVDREGITIWHSVPSIFRLIATGLYKYSDLRIIRLEGDKATPGDLRLYQKYFPDTCVLVNGLGATECGLVRQYFVNKKTPPPDGIVPIGHAVEDMEVLILNEAKDRVAMNGVGEIAIRSRFLAPGYWQRPELTETAFWNDPEDGDKRIYRTGDLGRMRDDGCLEYLGRKDFQQKLRGRWIDIPKIENVLHEMSGFNDVVVMTRDDPGFDTRLVAYLSPCESPTPKIDQIRQHLSQHVPEHMIPSVFVPIQSIPLNPFGKVDRNALPAPDQRRPEISEPYVAPQTPLQSRLTQLWEELLNVRPIGIRDNFFDLGGDSLSAACLFALIEKQIVGQNLPIATILQAPTVEQLAEIVGKGSWATSAKSLVPIQPAGFGPPFFCVHAHGGSVLGYRDLAYRLGPDLPFYGVQAQGLSGETIRARSFEEMASHYISEIRTVQPHGPYFLGGWCLGGTIAMEMAQQLQAQGEIVALLVMIDAPHPQYPKYLARSTPFFRQICRVFDRVMLEAADFFEVKPKAKLTHVMKRARRVLEIVLAGAEKIIRPMMAKMGLRTEHSLNYTLEALGEAHREAYSHYQPKPYTGKVLLLVAERQPLGIYPDASLGWGELIVGKLKIVKVPGHTRSLITEPRVRSIAQQIKECMEQARHGFRETSP